MKIAMRILSGVKQKMIIRIHNNDNSDYCDYTADTVDEIRDLCAERIASNGWDEGWSEIIDKDN